MRNLENGSSVSKDENLGNVSENQNENSENISEENNTVNENQNEEQKQDDFNIAEYKDKADINMDFFGIDLSQVPTKDIKNWKTLIIPVLYVISSFISIKFTTTMSKKKKEEQNERPALAGLSLFTDPLFHTALPRPGTSAPYRPRR